MQIFRLFVILLVSFVSSGVGAGTTVFWERERQEIDGFGGSSGWFSNRVMGFDASVREPLLKLLFDEQEGIGISILRVRIDPRAYPEDTREWDWEFTKVRRTIKLIQEARDIGVETVIASPWTPPTWMKSNRQAERGGVLLEEHYQAYADYLAGYLTGAEKQFGVTIDGLSLQNEADESKSWESCVWTVEQMTEVLRDYVGPTFERLGIDVDIMANEATMWNEAFKEWMRHMLDDAEAARYLDIVAGHRYRGPAASPFPEAREHGKRLWMTEYYYEAEVSSPLERALQNARIVHTFMTDAEVNAYLFWWLFADESKGNRQALVHLKEDEDAFEATKKLYAFGNFSRYVRPGYRRVALSEDEPAEDVYLCAFKDPGGQELVVVANNPGDDPVEIALTLEGVEIPAFRPFRTSATEDLAPLYQVLPKERREAMLRLPAQSITTYVGEVTTD